MTKPRFKLNNPLPAAKRLTLERIDQVDVLSADSIDQQGMRTFLVTSKAPVDNDFYRTSGRRVNDFSCHLGVRESPRHRLAVDLKIAEDLFYVALFAAARDANGIGLNLAAATAVFQKFNHFTLPGEVARALEDDHFRARRITPSVLALVAAGKFYLWVRQSFLQAPGSRLPDRDWNAVFDEYRHLV